MSGEYKKPPMSEGETPTAITKRTVPTTAEKIFKGSRPGMIWELTCDEDNTGEILLGKTADKCEYPMKASDVKVTAADLEKVWWKSDNGTEVMHIWGEADR